MNNDDILMLPIGSMTAHPFLDEDPMMDEASEDWLLLVDDIAANGIEHPLTVAEDGTVMDSVHYVLGDGRHRLKAAIAAGLREVPCKVVSPARLMEFMLRSESVRKNRSKTAQAWRACPFWHEAVQRNKSGRSKPQNLKNYQCSSDIAETARTDTLDMAQIARSVGVSTSMMQKVHSARYMSLPECADWPAKEAECTVREWVNRMIFEQDAGIDVVIGYIKGVKGRENSKQHTPDAAEKCARRGEYVALGWGKSFRHLEFWESFPKDQKRIVLDQAPQLAEKLPKEVRTVMIAKLMELERKGI